MPATHSEPVEEHSSPERFAALALPSPREATVHAPGDGEEGHAAGSAEAPRQAADRETDSGAGHGGEHGENVIPEDLPKPSTLMVAIVAGVFVLLLVALFLIGYFPERHRTAVADADAQEIAADVPVVSVAFPKKSDSARELIFPSDVRPNQTTAIYTRATGYLKHWYVDIQDHVKAGQLLAEIEAPDLDAQLVQAKASLQQDIANVTKSEADLKLAKITMDRYVESQKVSPGSVTQQQVDQERAAYDDAVAALAQAKAAVAQAQANVQQLTAEVGFEKVVAPFSGVITARNYDNGAFLAPPTAPDSTREMFDIAQTDLLRVFVSVPQQDATAVQMGKPVYLVVQNYPDRKFNGIVARTSSALDENTRTLTVELDFPNKDGLLYAGMYGEAHIPVSNAEGVLLIPSSALLFNAQGTSVGLVRDNKFHVQPVSVGRDFGTQMEITKGLTTEDQVISNPGEKLQENMPVQVAKDANGKPASGQPKSQSGVSASG